MDYAAALVAQNHLFSELVRDADPATPVPTCPGWSITQLLRHVGRGDRWAATIVRERVREYLDPRTVPGGKPPDDPDGMARWLRDSPRQLLEAVDEIGPDVASWTFLGPRPSAWWIRRRLHEATVHRADAALALGVEFELSAELAADGLSEWLDLVTARSGQGRPAPLAPGASLHLHATDEGLGESGEWFLRAEGSGLVWEHGHSKGSVAVRGRAVDLLLGTLRRLPAESDRLQVIGDASVWSGWLERTPF